MDSNGIIYIIANTIRRIAPLLISHHPDCSRFDKDTYRIFGKSICMGCSTAYPVATLLVISCAILRWDRSFSTLLIHKDLLLIIALSFGSFQMLKYILVIRSQVMRILIKIALGISLGSLIVWALTLPVAMYSRYAALLFFFSMIALVGTYRYNYLRKVCSGCVYHGDWDICYGFRNLNFHGRVRSIKDRLRIFSLIFDMKRKENLTKKGDYPLRDAYLLPEPALQDHPPWLYHNESYRIPWLPKTGLEVSERKDIPTR